MTHLAEEYAKSCGVKIGNPILNPHYFPILHDKYITIHNDKKVQAKKYEMWSDVIQILKPHLKDIKDFPMLVDKGEFYGRLDCLLSFDNIRAS